MNPIRKALLVPLFVLGIAASSAAPAQSTHASNASAASLGALGEIPAAAIDLLAAGGQFSVAAVRPSGHLVEVVLAASAQGLSFSVHLAAETVAALGVAAGTAVVVTAVSAGYLLSVGATVVAFVPSLAVQAMIHQRELSR